MKSGLFLPALLCVAGCGPPDSSVEPIPDQYQSLFGGGIAYEDMPGIRARLPYEKIELEVFSTWIWGGPVTTLWRDGRAERTSLYGERMKGEVRVQSFGLLCYLIDRLEFSAMEPEFHWGGFDASTVTVRVWPVGDPDPIEVADTGNVGPIDVWAIQTAIEGVASKIEWETVANPQVPR